MRSLKVPTSEQKRLRSTPARRVHPITPHRSRNGVSKELPPELGHISRAILSSRELLSLKGEDDRPVCDAATWKRAVTFLAKHARWLAANEDCIIDAPRIDPGPNGSIDLNWESDDFELLVNIRADPNEPAGFYGDDKGRLKIKGTLDPSAYNEGLLSWLGKRGGKLQSGTHSKR